MSDLVRHLKSATIVDIDPKEAADRWLAFRISNGRSAAAPLLSPPSANVKLSKTKDAVAYGLSLAPASLSGWQVCRFRTAACEAGCVAFAGKGDLPTVVAARVLKTRWLAEDPSAFVSLLKAEIRKAHAKFGDRLAVRLNTFSDLPWEDIVPSLFAEFSDVQFYDYTKWTGRDLPANYDITRSATEHMSDADIVDLVDAGNRVAVVFSPSRFKALPSTWMGVDVVDGDQSDARFLDGTAVVVGLRAKGRMRLNPNGFVRAV